MGHQDADGHGHHANDAEVLGIGVLTISSSRSLDDDPSGDAIVAAVEGDGHAVVARDLVPDDRQTIRDRVAAFVDNSKIDVVITTGGTGVAPTDVTIDALQPLFDRQLSGFGERFRARSADEVGPRSMLSDASAGIARGVPVFCLPGSTNAVELGVGELILPTVGHVVGLVDEGGDRQPGDDLTHVDDGEAGMVDVGSKPDSRRRAVARGRLQVQPSTVEAIRADELAKGDVLATVRIGAVDAVKHTWETIPLCHQIPVTNVDTDIELRDSAVELTVAVETVGQTGCEMEALQGVTTGLGVAWDMVKAAEKDETGNYPDTRIEDVRILEKTKRV